MYVNWQKSGLGFASASSPPRMKHSHQLGLAPKNHLSPLQMAFQPLNQIMWRARLSF